MYNQCCVPHSGSQTLVCIRHTWESSYFKEPKSLHSFLIHQCWRTMTTPCIHLLQNNLSPKFSGVHLLMPIKTRLMPEFSQVALRRFLQCLITTTDPDANRLVEGQNRVMDLCTIYRWALVIMFGFQNTHSMGR